MSAKMFIFGFVALAAAGLGGIGISGAPTTNPAETNSQRLIPLHISLAPPPFGSALVDIPTNAHTEPFPTRSRLPLMAPVGVTNVSVGRPVHCSDAAPLRGNPATLVAGILENAKSDEPILLHAGPQWVQIDLEGRPQIYAIVVWHSRWPPSIAHDVLIQVGDDPSFHTNIHTLFNNDYNNSLGLGQGKDKEYLETYEGRLIEARGLRGRYVRLYSNGSSAGKENPYLAIEVYGLPDRGGSATPQRTGLGPDRRMPPSSTRVSSLDCWSKTRVPWPRARARLAQHKEGYKQQHLHGAEYRG